MAWIKSFRELEHHPKAQLLGKLLEQDMDTTIGQLHRLWWWCLAYAENGYLDKWGVEKLSQILGLKIDKFVEAGFIDAEFLRIHDWWDYAGSFLQSKYKHQKKKWFSVKKLYNGSKNGSSTGSNNTTDKIDKIDKTRQERPDEIVIPKDLENNTPEINDWLAYKKQRGESYKSLGLAKLWNKLRDIPVEKRRASVDHCIACNYKGLFEKNGSVPDEKKKEFVI